jgi:phosphoglycolate phosphatase-like HAD superfamily hydrolase
VKLLLFDVDQTLISTGGAGIRALNRAFQELFALENAMEGIAPGGKTDPGIIREIFSIRGGNGEDPLPGKEGVGGGHSMERILETYLMYLRQEIAACPYRVLPGIDSVLHFLSLRSDVMLGLATGNIELGARIKLERGNLNRYFKFGGFGSDFEDRTALVRHGAQLGFRCCETVVAPHDVFVIGDTPRDIDAGREAGFTTIGVATGKFSANELAQAGASAVLADFERDRDQFFRTTRIE